MKTNLRQWQVVEDNGGGLHLFMFDDDGTTFAATSGYEHNPGNLMLDIQAWYMTGSVDGWEGLEPNAQSNYNAMTASPAHGAIIAQGDSTGAEFYIDSMGSAGHIALGDYAKQFCHQDLMMQASVLIGNVTDDPGEVDDLVWLVDDLAEVVQAHYADLCHGIDPDEWPEDAEQWFARHGIEFQ